jgi:hypothetical protein
LRAASKLIIAYNQFGKAMGEGIVCPLVLPLALGFAMRAH